MLKRLRRLSALICLLAAGCIGTLDQVVLISGSLVGPRESGELLIYEKGATGEPIRELVKGQFEVAINARQIGREFRVEIKCGQTVHKKEILRKDFTSKDSVDVGQVQCV
jgi:hypothetical protein